MLLLLLFLVVVVVGAGGQGGGGGEWGRRFGLWHTRSKSPGKSRQVGVRRQKGWRIIAEQ